MRKCLLASIAMVAMMSFAGPGTAGVEEARKWIDSEFQPSTLSKEDQLKELEWFVKAAEPFQGMEVNVLSETIPTHSYESEVLTRAFQEITGQLARQVSIQAFRNIALTIIEE